MIDSVLKGTGNSRFLKSAVPAGTSWADALAMLQAGTFPIDFNGINTEGFQQVGTPLNKANLLKDATALTLGLTGDVVPNDMFNVLAHAGDLHVWRKMVTTTEPTPEVPAGYNLGTATKTAFLTPTDSSNSAWIYRLSVSKTVSVDSVGNVSMVSPESKDVIVSGNGTISVDNIIGSGNRFFSVTGDSYANRGTINIERNVVYYVASGTTFTYGILSSRTPSYFNAAQKVVGYPVTPAIPAGTTTTYPVSTNRNAYQEGNDAKPAGYTLGEVVTGKFRVSSSYVQGTAYWKYGTSLTVSDEGTVNIADSSSVSLSGSSSSVASNAQQMAGKYAVCTSVSDTGYEPDFPIGTVVFFPSDTLFTRLDSSCWASKYQPVTGYAAIPANTTIEYLGCLGDKARVQVVSYVGTGTYGSEHPTVVNFDFPPKVFLIGTTASSGGYGNAAVAGCGWISTTQFDGASARPYSIGFEGKKVSIYSSSGSYYGSPLTAYNQTGWTYIAVALG